MRDNVVRFRVQAGLLHLRQHLNLPEQSWSGIKELQDW